MKQQFLPVYIQDTSLKQGHTCHFLLNNLHVKSLSVTSRSQTAVMSSCTDKSWSCLVNNDTTPGTVWQHPWWCYWDMGTFLNHSWKPYIQVKLIWMQYLKWKSSEPQVSFINSGVLDQQQKVTWWHHDSVLMLTLRAERETVRIDI